MYLITIRFLLAGVILALVASTITGCFSQNSHTRLTAELLGVNQLAALKSISGEARLQQLVLVRAEGDEISSRSIGEAYDFEVSNDGRYIAYVADDGLYVVSTDGEKARMVSELSPKFDLNTDQVRVINKVMAWSPDNTRLAFVCGGDLFMVNVNEAEEPKLLVARTPDRLIIKEGAPALAPRIDGIICPDWLDNKTLIYQDFYRIFDGEWRFVYDIMKVNVDGSDKQILIGNGQEPVISPDKEKILYHRSDNFGGTIMLALVDGSEDPRLLGAYMDTDQETMNYSWSKDGKFVIFDGFAINPDKERQIPFIGDLAQDPQYPRGKSNYLPASSPDGRWMIFSTSHGPKLIEFKEGSFEYDSSEAFKPLADLGHIQWVKGK
jgi:Tol biopolymer transport system component